MCFGQPCAFRQKSGRKRLLVSGNAIPGQTELSIRIVEVEYFSNRKWICGSQAGGVLRVPLNPERPSHVVRDNSAHCVAIMHVRCCVSVGKSRDDVGRATHCRDENAIRPSGVARRKAAHGKGSAH